ncbi:DUF2975 domain-containing protein [Brevundimonas sp.]|uniref:DUF2975 domain-containing protein n=1 Tax=Brevundimonas sp. TaxID=1871086 RepID=UPI002BA3D23C|nr:DUF2975 domain-containing protein [Brevundimonas sp.]HWQ86732.1 DUF2975 domain-containing protein [Brevundimonas sp.]
MSQTDLVRFRRMCGQFRWLAVFMVVTIGALLTMTNLVGAIAHWTRESPATYETRYLVGMIWALPPACYLFGVWSIGQAMGQISKGRLFQPAVASALRRVGLALGIGGVFSVFIMSNLLRVIGEARGGYLHFDVPGMTLGMIGGALFLLGRVIDQASRVQAELDEMI